MSRITLKKENIFALIKKQLSENPQIISTDIAKKIKFHLRSLSYLEERCTNKHERAYLNTNQIIAYHRVGAE